MNGQVPLSKIGTNYNQYIDQQELIKPLAHFSTLTPHPDTLPEVLSKALEVSLREGTVSHISVPSDLFDAATTKNLYQKPVVLQHNHGFDNFEQVTNLMDAARKPMILIGSGARNAGKEIEHLAEIWGAGVLTSLWMVCHPGKHGRGARRTTSKSTCNPETSTCRHIHGPYPPSGFCDLNLPNWFIPIP